MNINEKAFLRVAKFLDNPPNHKATNDGVVSLIQGSQKGMHTVMGDCNGVQQANDILSTRNNEVNDLLAGSRIALDTFLHPLTGAPYIKRGDLESQDIPQSVKEFFQIQGNILTSGGPILSGRGPHYYFQYPGIQIQGNPLSIKTTSISRDTDSSVNLSGISKYCESILFQLKKVKDLQLELVNSNSPFPQDLDELIKNNTYQFESMLPLSEEAKRALLVLIDQEKNILLFLANILVILLDKNFLNPDFEGNLVFNREQVTSLIRQNPSGFQKFKELQKELQNKQDILLSDLVVDIANIGFLEILLDNQFKKVVRSNTLTSHVIIRILKTFLTFLESAVANGKVNSKTKKVNWDKLFEIGVLKVIRFSREEDDIRSMTLSMFSLAQKIIDEVGLNGNIDIYGILYGGIELPFILDDILRNDYYGFNGVGFSGGISIHLVSYSIYDLKNRTVTFSSQNYPGVNLVKSNKQSTKSGEFSQFLRHKIKYLLGKEKSWKKKQIAVILDDNLFSGDTISGFERLIKNEGKYDYVMSQVSTVMIDDRSGGGMKQSRELLHKHLPHTGKTLPVVEKNGKYSHPIVSLVGKRIERMKSI